MSLSQLNKDELRKLCDVADVPYDESETKAVLLDKLKESNVSFDFYKKAVLGGEEEDDEPLFKRTDVLLKMERKNPTFSAYGYNFTREHPFAVVSEEAAQLIMDNFEGFRPASPGEAKSFYDYE